MNLTYTDWRNYLINQCGDLRALTITEAEWLENLALDRKDHDMLEVIDLYMGA